MACWRRGAPAGPGACGCRGLSRLDASSNEWRRDVGLDPLPHRRVPECALQDGLVQVVALPGDTIKVDPGAPGLALDSVHHQPRRAMPTRSFSCGRGPTVACGGRNGKEARGCMGVRIGGSDGPGAWWSGSTWPGEALARTAGPTRWSDEGPVGRTLARPPPRSGSRVTCLPASGCGPPI